jgi:hypothetical protein
VKYFHHLYIKILRANKNSTVDWLQRRLFASGGRLTNSIAVSLSSPSRHSLHKACTDDEEAKDLVSPSSEEDPMDRPSTSAQV